TLHDVDFTYPGMPVAALLGVSMELRRGEVVALVGENGSGKTTLAKLVCGLYRPGRGAVRWDGTDLRELEPVTGSVAVLFQDFCQFCLSVRDNIGVGRTELAGDETAVVEASRRAGAHPFIRDLPRGYDTLLGVEFEDGVDLSVGQWQRLALA